MGAFLESLFEKLFKYRPVVFEQGDLALGATWPTYVLLAIGLAVAVPAVLTYARVRGKSSARDRAVLAGLRVAALAVLAVCLLRPMLLVSTAVPQRNVLGILVDDSRSMQVADVDGKPRAEFVRAALNPEQGELVRELSQKFTLRFFRFSRGTDRVQDVSEVTFTGGQTHIGSALLRARQELATVPLSGLVVMTDGADNANLAGDASRRGGEPRYAAGAASDAPALTEALLSLKAKSVPVYTVGLGKPTLDRDVEIARVETPRQVLEGASLVVDVVVAQNGYKGAKVPLVIEDAGRIVSSQEITLPAADGESAPVRVRVPTSETGPRLFKFKIPVQQGEQIAQNNEREALVTVADRREKILYLEGEPRHEFKFLRRAVADDENLQLVSILRSAENKYLRLSVDDSLELLSGFPKTRDELFRYRGIILGSIEASFFTIDQLRMMADFVSERGGGLLMLGGRRAFAEGGYAGTPLADVLPVVLQGGDDRSGKSANEQAADSFIVELKASATPAGATHAAVQITDSEQGSVARWRELPPVTAVNRLHGLKPGAIVLLEGTPTSGGASQPLLVYQRFGRGKAIAFPTQDSWLWQMHADIGVEDLTHETLWRQLTRWMVSDVPGRVTVAAATERATPGEPVALRTEVSDGDFVKVNDARVVARVTSPSGVVSEVPMEWTVQRDGEYRASFVPDEKGVYHVAVEARGKDGTAHGDSTWVQAAETTDEFFEAGMRSGLLQRVAEETGGRYYTPETISRLPKDVMYTKSGVTVREQKDLWDMPAIFLLLIAIIGAEWGYRRYRGLA